MPEVTPPYTAPATPQPAPAVATGEEESLSAPPAVDDPRPVFRPTPLTAVKATEPRLDIAPREKAPQDEEDEFPDLDEMTIKPFSSRLITNIDY
jgi:hypothetical protein